MFEKQNLPPSEQPATIVYQLVVFRHEHVHINFCKLQLVQFCQTFVSLVKIDALATRDLVVLGFPGQHQPIRKRH